MSNYATITPDTALKALIGKPSTCCWETEVIGYYVRLWQDWPDGESVLLDERHADTIKQARLIAKQMTA